MIIAQISDTHLALDIPDSKRRIGDFERAIADINTLDPAPNLILHTGDIVHNGRDEEYAEAVRILDAACAPVFVVPGNKDDRANLRKAFAGRGHVESDSAFIQYAIEDHPIRLIAIDTLHVGSNKGDFCPVRERQLRDLVSADASKPIAVFMHHPPFRVSVGPDPVNFETEEAMQRLSRLLMLSGRVAAIFCGHVHRAATGEVGHIPAMVVPAAATTLRHGDFSPDFRTRPVYYVHRLDAVNGPITEARFAVGVENS